MFSVNMNLNLQDNVSFKVRTFEDEKEKFILTITETDTIYNNNQVIFLNRDQLELLYATIGGSLAHD